MYFNKEAFPHIFRKIWKGTEKTKSNSTAVPLYKSLIHPHLCNYVLLFSPIKQGIIELQENENKDDQRNETESSLQMFQGYRVYKTMRGIRKTDRD